MGQIEKHTQPHDDTLDTLFIQVSGSYEMLLVKEQERICECEQAEIPESLKRRVNHVLKGHCSGTRKQSTKRILNSGPLKAAICFLVFCACIAMLSVTTQAFWDDLYTMLLGADKRYTKVSYVEAPNGQNDVIKATLSSFSRYMPGWLPEGYQISDVYKASGSNYIIYDNPEGKKLIYGQNTIRAESYIDNERSKAKSIMLGDNVCYINHTNDKLICHWSDTRYVYCIYGRITEDELLHVIQNIKEWEE